MKKSQCAVSDPRDIDAKAVPTRTNKPAAGPKSTVWTRRRLGTERRKHGIIFLALQTTIALKQGMVRYEKEAASLRWDTRSKMDVVRPFENPGRVLERGRRRPSISRYQWHKRERNTEGKKKKGTTNSRHQITCMTPLKKMKEIREGNIFIYKLCICIKSRTHYTPKKKKNSHTDTHAQEWAYIETQDTRQQWWTISCEVWRESRSRRKASTRVVRSACLAEVSDRCGKKKKQENCFPVTSKRCASLRDCVQETACVSSLCCVLSDARKKKEKTRKGKWSKEEKQKSVPYLCVHNGFWKGKVGWRCSKGRKLTYDMHKKDPRKSNSARRET